MPLALTPQEKKVLGFTLLLFLFGLCVLGLKRCSGPEPLPPSRIAQ